MLYLYDIPTSVTDTSAEGKKATLFHLTEGNVTYILYTHGKSA